MAVYSTSEATLAPWWEFVPSARQDSDVLTLLGGLPGLKEWLMLRQVHALEHATVWVLGEWAARNAARRSPSRRMDAEAQLSGLSTEQGFYLYGNVNTLDLRYAVNVAQRRLTHGEWQLAIHPRCGTNVSVGIVLTAGLVLGTHWLLPRGPIEQLIGLGIATTTAAWLTPELGKFVQRYVTTAIPFNLAIAEINPLQSFDLPPTHFVKVQWVDQPQMPQQSSPSTIRPIRSVEQPVGVPHG